MFCNVKMRLSRHQVGDAMDLGSESEGSVVVGGTSKLIDDGWTAGRKVNNDVDGTTSL